MPTRREFLQAGLAASVIPVVVPPRHASGITPGSPTGTPPHHALYRAVCDMRSPASVTLAEEAERLGLRVVRTNGDITDFWFEDLSLRWKEEPVPIAGLTGQGPLFCLERLGWDYGMRVVFRGTHRFLPDGCVEHVMAGPPGMLADARAAGIEEGDWPCALARLVGRCEIVRERSSITLAGIGLSGEPVDRDETLVSWVIAPLPRRLAGSSSTDHTREL